MSKGFFGRLVLLMVVWIPFAYVLEAALMRAGVSQRTVDVVIITLGLAVGWYWERIVIWVNDKLKPAEE